MKSHILYLFGAAMICSCNLQPPVTEEEAVNIIKKFDEGWKNKNLHTVDSVLSPAYVYFTQSGGTFSRDSVVATAGHHSYTLEHMSRSDFTVSLYDNAAVVSTRWKGKGIYRGMPFDEDQRCSIVVIKKDDKVEILSEHCTPIKQIRIFH